ncbi:efflux RND transporter periplasmic adaptor subunit [Marinilabiliaceae bacterium JC017]|nr:efflux RND transporter periplasmic adaptor subunit [Marinilabiliaceae bacterium JC017]
MKRQAIQAVSLLMLTIIGFSFYGCSSKETATEVQRRYVKVMQLTPAATGEECVFNGQLREKKEVNVAFKVGGQVLDIRVDEGDYVKAGDVIAIIDPRDYKIHLQAAKAQYQQMKGEYERYKQLYEKKKLPVNTLEKLEAGYLSAESAYEAAQNALQDTELKAPFAGYIYRKNIDKFENVGPGQSIVALIDVSHLEVYFSLSESQVGMASQFEKITCDVLNAKVHDVPAKVLSVNEKSNGNDMFDVRLIIENNQQNSLKPGMSVKVKAKMPQVSHTNIRVPVESVFYKEKKAFVWIYNPGDSSVMSRQVIVDRLGQHGFVGVSKGLKRDEMVVTAGVYSLSENQPVKILKDKNL